MEDHGVPVLIVIRGANREWIVASKPGVPGCDNPNRPQLRSTGKKGQKQKAVEKSAQ